MGGAGSIQILCLVLAALVLLWSGALLSQWQSALTVLGAFAGVMIVSRVQRAFPRASRTKRQIECWSMLGFVTAIVWLTGKSAGPALNLYLLPLTASALTLGRVPTLVQFGIVAACHVAMAAATPGVDLASWGYAGRAVGELAPFLLVAYTTAKLSAENSRAREHVNTMAHTDPLTGLCNDRTFNEIWRREHATRELDRSDYALLVIDMDKLRDINAQFGHESGNSALLLVAQCLLRSIRDTDIAARLGGDEFAVLLPGATAEIAESVVHRVRHNGYKTTLNLRSQMIRCSVSIGVVTFPKDGHDMRELFSSADRNMYRDKELRRAPAAAAGG